MGLLSAGTQSPHDRRERLARRALGRYRALSAWRQFYASRAHATSSSHGRSSPRRLRRSASADAASLAIGPRIAPSSGGEWAIGSSRRPADLFGFPPGESYTRFMAEARKTVHLSAKEYQVLVAPVPLFATL
jgi:hypothetical protein